MNEAEEQAAEWLAKLRSGSVVEADRLMLESWLAASAHNSRALKEAAQLWEELEQLKAHPTMLSMREQAREDIRHGRMKRLTMWAAAACAIFGIAIAATLALGTWRSGSVEPQTYATRVGERSNILLADGSLLMLDTNSAARVKLDDTERRVQLVRGRAFFKVAKNPRRPFIVEAGDHSVTALGTQFGIDLFRSALRVTLTEGRVRVQDEKVGHVEPTVDMKPGYQLLSDAHGISLTRMDPRIATGWTSGRLVFDNARLDDIAAELGRYSRRPIIIAPAIAAQRMSAVLPSDSPDAFLASAEALKLGHRLDRPDAYVLTSR